MLLRISLISLAASLALSAPASANSCCILKGNKNTVCVNADPVTCKSHKRYVKHNAAQVCKSPGSQDIRCVNRPKGFVFTEQQMSISLEVMGDEYKEKLMRSLETTGREKTARE